MAYYDGKLIMVHSRRRLESVYNVANHWNISPLDAAELINNVESRQTIPVKEEERKKEIHIDSPYIKVVYIFIELSILIWISKKINYYLRVIRY